MHTEKGSALSARSHPATGFLQGLILLGHWPPLQHLLREKQSVDTELNKQPPPTHTQVNVGLSE